MCDWFWREGFTSSSPLGFKIEVAQTMEMIDPMHIKQLIQNEILFNNIRIQHIMTGDQGARDLLLILDENKDSWS